MKNWPKTVDLLDKGDFAHGQFCDNEKRCLAGWVGKVFAGSDCGLPYPPDHGPNSIKAARTMVGVLAASKTYEARAEIECCVDEMGSADLESVIIRFNDHPDTTDAERLRVWRATIKKLGYTEKV